MLSFDVTHMMLVLCRGGAPDVGCCTQHGSQHGRNILATLVVWALCQGEEGGDP
jgi:hypothetical protein